VVRNGSKGSAASGTITKQSQQQLKDKDKEGRQAEVGGDDDGLLPASVLRMTSEYLSIEDTQQSSSAINGARSEGGATTANDITDTASVAEQQGMMLFCFI
jgi:hypothetical protein